MRKLISLGLFALIITGFSGHLLAGDPSECADLKGDKDNPGLYGLCIAWHNADANGNEEARLAIEERYREKSGGDEVPGSGSTGGEGQYDFMCPCWSEETVDSILARGAPILSNISESPDYTGVFYGLVLFPDGDTIEQFINFPTACNHIYNSGSSTIPANFSSSSSLDALNCGFELGCIANLQNTGDCPDS